MNREEEAEMARNYTITFRIETDREIESVDQLEAEMKDLISIAIAPTLGFRISPLTFTVKKARI
jgi:hypothetical protein